MNYWIYWTKTGWFCQLICWIPNPPPPIWTSSFGQARLSARQTVLAGMTQSGRLWVPPDKSGQALICIIITILVLQSHLPASHLPYPSKAGQALASPPYLSVRLPAFLTQDISPKRRESKVYFYFWRERTFLIVRGRRKTNPPLQTCPGNIVGRREQLNMLGRIKKTLFSI